MREGYAGKREIQLDLAKPRNPYLEKEFGTSPKRPTVVRKMPVSRKKQQNIRLSTQKRRQRRKAVCRHFLKTGAIVVIVVLLFFLTINLFLEHSAAGSRMAGAKYGTNAQVVNNFAEKPEWTVDYLTPNEYSRPGEAIGTVQSIFVHYTANQGTSAAQNRSYFEQLKDTHERSASAHFIIGYEGEIIQCIPLNEIAYAVQTRNYDSISIECCYLAEDGAFSPETEESLVKLLAYLLKLYDLTEEDILRHYDCGGKKCPLYYVENEEAWEDLKDKVSEAMGNEIP